MGHPEKPIPKGRRFPLKSRKAARRSLSTARRNGSGIIDIRLRWQHRPLVLAVNHGRAPRITLWVDVAVTAIPVIAGPDALGVRCPGKSDKRYCRKRSRGPNLVHGKPPIDICPINANRAGIDPLALIR